MQRTLHQFTNSLRNQVCVGADVAYPFFLVIFFFTCLNPLTHLSQCLDICSGGACTVGGLAVCWGSEKTFLLPLRWHMHMVARMNIEGSSKADEIEEKNEQQREAQC